MLDEGKKITITFGNLPFWTILFVLLKLTGIVDWSWWWVFCPVWIPILIIVVFILFWLIIHIFTELLQS